MKTANIPLNIIGPIKITGPEVNEEIQVPLATYESTLWPSTNRGAKVSVLAGGINTLIIDDRMTRSILLEAPSVNHALNCLQGLQQRRAELEAVTKVSSRYATLLDFHFQITANLLFLRFEFSTGDASGHNMTTKASEHILYWILSQYPELSYVSLSGNYCTDKKANAVDGILGRGKNVIADILIPEKIVEEVLKTTPKKIVDLNIKKNFIGSINAGSVRSANAHFANLLLALYLATGQDAANTVEGSQGITHTELRGNDLYFSVTIPNIIVGTIGHGKELDFVKENLNLLGCLEKREPGQNARRLAIITAATVLCGELSLLAALTNPDELMRAHTQFERQNA